MPSPSAAKKQRIYEVAKELGMSSEVIQQIAKKLGVEVKNHMSTLGPDIVDKVRAELGKEKAAAREEVVRQQEHEAQRARDERQRAQAAQQAAAQAAQQAQQQARIQRDASVPPTAGAAVVFRPANPTSTRGVACRSSRSRYWRGWWRSRRRCTRPRNLTAPGPSGASGTSRCRC